MSAPSVLLVSCYELGRQPFNIASPWAQLEAAGFSVAGCDTAVEELKDAAVSSADLVAISVPMHTALRLGVDVARRVRALNSAAHVCFFGLYAALNADHLLAARDGQRPLGDSVIGGEFEEELVELARALAAGQTPAARPPVALRKLPFAVPRRDRLAPLDRYAAFFGPKEGEVRPAGYVEASRGCLHTCRHCPVTPVYRGRFFVVPPEIVIADAEQQIAAGAGHLTFGDPDFFNGPRHGLAILAELHRRHPEVSFDATVKVEHLVRHRERVIELGRLGVSFVVSAVESLSDVVLALLRKGHVRADVFEALAICRSAGVTLRPTFVAFTPWTLLDDYLEVIDWIAGDDLVDALDPIQLAIRLLLPPGSALLEGEEERPWLGPLDPDGLGYGWTHPDPRMERLFRDVSDAVERGQDRDPAETFLQIRALAYAAAGRRAEELALSRRFVPRLSEAWFCCAEPSARQWGQRRRA